jgi:DNA repair protein RadC
MMKLTVPEVRETTTSRISASMDVLNYCKDMDGMSQEVFCVLTLNTKNYVIENHIIAVGQLSSCLVSPREVFTRALLDSANSIILVHNHPSGDCVPSREDIQITKQIQEAGKIIGVTVLDHVIIGKDRHYSLRDNGEMTV